MLTKLKQHINDLFHPVLCEVWLLHSITTEYSEDKGLRACDVSPATLEYKIQEALADGKKFISVAELEKLLLHASTHCALRTTHYTLHNPRYICLTLDDGYRNNQTTALPIFQKYNVPFCVFVCPGFITGACNPGHDNNMKEMLSIEELKQLASNPLCTIGSHTMSHLHMNEANSEVQIQELKTSKDMLETWIGTPVDYFAYPYGGINKASFDALKAADYRFGFGAWGGAIRKGKYSRWWIPRVIISEIIID